MSQFYKIADYQGVDDGVSPPTIMVPTGDYNLIVHDFGRAAKQTVEGNFKVIDITDGLSDDIGNTVQKVIKIAGKKADVSEVSGRLWSTRKTFPDLGSQKRLLAISASAPLDGKLTIKGAKESGSLTVAARSRVSGSLSFLFYTYTGDDVPVLRAGGKYVPKHGPNDGANIVSTLNQYFLPQANVEFNLAASNAWPMKQWIPLFTQQLIDREKFDDKIDKKADWTVFVIPAYDDGKGFAVHRGPPGAKQTSCWVPNSPTGEAAVTVPEKFIIVLAHELGHSLGIGGEDKHPKRNGVLGANIGEGIRGGILIDYLTLNMINPLKK
jgi:hypothetical protein